MNRTRWSTFELSSRQPLRLLTGVDVLGNTSSTLGQAGRILAEVSMDRVFVRRRNRAERMSNVEGLGSGIKEGARALGRALARGIYGTVARPLQVRGLCSRKELFGYHIFCI